jgi:mono/diheme cytochrome c family protein
MSSARVVNNTIIAATILGYAAFGIAADQRMEQGKVLYDQRCGICHARGGTGTLMLGRRLGVDNAVLARRADLQVPYVSLIVRNGINAMPLFTRGEVTDAELALIAAYLTRSAEIRSQESP